MADIDPYPMFDGDVKVMPCERCGEDVVTKVVLSTGEGDLIVEEWAKGNVVFLCPPCGLLRLAEKEADHG